MKKYKLLILFFTFLVVSGILFETIKITNQYYKEKIHDIKLQYKDHLNAYKKVIHLTLKEIVKDELVLEMLKNRSRDNLYLYLKPTYEALQEAGVSHLQFHLADQTDFLHFTDPSVYGQSAKEYRPSLTLVKESNKSVTGFEGGHFFEGFRFIYPLYDQGLYLGSVEAGVSFFTMLEDINKNGESTNIVVLEKKELEKRLDKEYVKNSYGKSCINENFYVSKHFEKTKACKESLEKVKGTFFEEMKNYDAFSTVFYVENFSSRMATFLPLSNISGEKVGYFISLRNDATIYEMYKSEGVKILIVLFLVSLLYFMIKKVEKNVLILDQFKSFVDQTTLVSHTDLKGNITYVNDMFVELSGYSREELMGKPHNIVRHPDVPKGLYKGMWKALNIGKPWFGKIRNRKKNGDTYMVDTGVFPILNEKEEVVEYIAIRHDITELEEYKDILQLQLLTQTKNLDEQSNLLKQYQNGIEESTAFFRVDNNNKISYVNETLLFILGVRSEALIGMDFDTIYGKYDDLIDVSIIRAELSKHRTTHRLLNCVKSGGNECYLETTFIPVFDTQDNLIEIMGIAFDVTRIYELTTEIEETQKEVVFTMGSIGEARSKETSNHVKRVAEYSYLLAIHYGFSEKEAKLLREASPMHDIGKVGISDAILNKPGKLDAKEWETMMTHAELGYEMLKHSQRKLLKAAATVAYEHHEKWDGSGYPRGLEGENIHIYGRITAVADVFDALGSDRVYKKAWPLEKITALLKEESGKHFDPTLIKIFFEHKEEFLEVRERFKDT